MVVRLQDREILLPEMAIPRLATVKGEEKREIRIVGVEQIQGAQVEGMVAGNGGEKSVQQIVFFFVQLGVVNAEHFVEVGARAVHLGEIEVINNDGQGELAEV